MVNQAFSRKPGYAEAEALGQNPRLLALGAARSRILREHVRGAIKSLGHWQGEIWNRRKDGGVPRMVVDQPCRARWRNHPLHRNLYRHRPHKAAEASIQRLAHFDPLTGLPNRSLLDERVKHDLIRAHRSREPLALILPSILTVSRTSMTRWVAA